MKRVFVKTVTVLSAVLITVRSFLVSTYKVLAPVALAVSKMVWHLVVAVSKVAWRRVVVPFARTIDAKLPFRFGGQLTVHHELTGVTAIRVSLTGAQILGVTVTPSGDRNIILLPGAMLCEELNAAGAVVSARHPGNELVTLPAPADTSADVLRTWAQECSPLTVTYTTSPIAELLDANISDGQVAVHVNAA